ncbi:MAG TPA: argininosuccinate lyase [Usitatibacter sp.]|nr:argininosuccinate lyase [Usitatibacter sp.]
MKAGSVALGLSLVSLVQPALAADTGQLPCKTTAECEEQSSRLGATGATAGEDMVTSRRDALEDGFYWIGKINRASAVMLTEERIVTPEMGRKLARGVEFSLEQAAKPDGKRPSDVLQIEKIITGAIGPDASLVHTGRSRQDMYATLRMAKLRNQVLDFSEALDAMRARMLAMAAKNVDTLVPAYTNGVQAQPTSYAHYLLAYEASFARDAQRIHELYARMNRSAMGAGVLGNSIWPLNRARMADLLGFDGIIENSLDATEVSPFDMGLEATGIAGSTAIRVGVMIQDIHTQYHQTRPWLLLDESVTYASSAMPQKRNPGLLNRAREEASLVTGLVPAVAMRDHNVTTGMRDYKRPWDELGFFVHAVRMVEKMDAVFDGLRIHPERSLEELENDWTPSMEIAEVLQKEHQIPFRVGHAFASSIVGYARANGLRPKDFPYAKARDLYAETIERFKLPDRALPMAEARFRQVLSPAWVVQARVGIGGPQPAEVRRMLGEANGRLQQDQEWMRATRARLADADLRLDAAFRKLLAG